VASKIPCNECKIPILYATAQRNRGLCAKCIRSRKHLTKGSAQIGLGIGVIFLMLGMTIAWYGVHIVKKVEAARHSWPTVDGIIIESGMRTEKRTHSASKVGSTSRGDDSSEMLDVSYEYTVDGITLTSNQVGIWGIGGSGGGESDAIEVSRGYRKGDVVEVYYNPRNHSDVMLDPNLITSWTLHIPLAFGLFLAIGGAFHIVRNSPVALRRAGGRT
jgi:hypothetical protein